MAENLPALVPRCKNHGPMTVVSGGGRSEISRWCGVWYECAYAPFRCGNAVLIPSAGLLAQLDEQRVKAGA
jgi:hypothetical protein